MAYKIALQSLRTQHEMGYHTKTTTSERLYENYSLTQTRTLRYQFHLHQHPYVRHLIQRLLEDSTRGLLAYDTEHEARVRLTAALTASDAQGNPLPLAPTQILHVPEGTGVRLVADGSQVRFSGSRAIGAQGLAVPLAADDLVRLPARTQVRLDDGRIATLGEERQAALVDPGPRPVLYDAFFKATYDPTDLVDQDHLPVKELDFGLAGAYSIYNWELFHHVPFTIATHLSKNQRFAEAQRWFHYLFDPTDDSTGTTPERFWKVKPFQSTEVRKVEDILVNLATNDDPTLRAETELAIAAWMAKPFRPHVVAAYRPQAYMYKTVMAYLDNLLDWGDSLFRQDTGEAIDEALMLYVLAAAILGPRPQAIPKKGTVRPQTYSTLRDELGTFTTALVDLESDVGFDLSAATAPGTGATTQGVATIRSLGKALYFAVPRNDKLMAYWDKVADRLFKIRNSLNFQGTFRQLALFEPAIDPAMLARAAAAGLDVGAVVNGLNQPLPLVRFPLLVQKATEVCQEVKSLGANLLAAMEKEDGEAMALLRARHERTVMELVEQVKYGQLQEARKSKEALLEGLAGAVQRYRYFEQQLGRPADAIERAVPALSDLDKDALVKMKLKAEEPRVEPRAIAIDIASDLGASGGKIVSSHEAQEMEKLQSARDLQDVAQVINLAGQAAALLPLFGIDFHFWGMGGDAKFGGPQLAEVAKFAAGCAAAVAERDTYEAGKAAKVGGYARREQDWAHQSNLAAAEITQVFKQVRAAEIREAVAELELRNHQRQAQHAAEVERFLNAEGNDRKGKKTNQALYTWMKREVKGLYAQSFQFAYDIAKKAERALQHEVGDASLTYIQFGYLAGKEGLLAGERLLLDVKRMEMAHHELNQREYELTKHVSLLQVDPLALIELRRTGRCTVRLPEALFDLDGPGHYFRRIKTVAVSIPCVTGPYASVNCTLTLLKSSIRKAALLRDGAYARDGPEDDRFSDYFGSLQSIVTSTGQNDSGLFETNLRDERYLPFENSGAISEWQLQLPANPGKGEPAQFDYSTISDVILHLRYTAREGGGLLRKGATTSVAELLKQAQAAGSVRLFSLRHDFPTEWAQFKGQTVVAGQRAPLSIKLKPEHYPFWSQGKAITAIRVDLLGRRANPPAFADIENGAAGAGLKRDTLAADDALGKLLAGHLANIAPPATGNVNLTFADKDWDDLWIAVAWSA